MNTPEQNKIMDELKQELERLKNENVELRKQIEQARKAAEDHGNSDWFDECFG